MKGWIEKKYEFIAPVEEDIFIMTNKERAKKGIDSLPDSLKEAVAITEKSEVVRKAPGDHIFNILIANKKKNGIDTGHRLQVINCLNIYQYCKELASGREFK